MQEQTGRPLLTQKHALLGQRVNKLIFIPRPHRVATWRGGKYGQNCARRPSGKSEAVPRGARWEVSAAHTPTDASDRPGQVRVGGGHLWIPVDLSQVSCCPGPGPVGRVPMSPLNFLLRTHPHAASGDFSAWKMISFKYFRIHTFSKNYESPCCARLPRSGWLVGGSDTLLIHPSNQSEMGDRDYMSKQRPTLRSPRPVGALEEVGEGRWQGAAEGGHTQERALQGRGSCSCKGPGTSFPAPPWFSDYPGYSCPCLLSISRGHLGLCLWLRS